MGYRYPAKTIRFDGDPETPFAGLWVDLVQVRTGEELRALANNRYWSDLLPIMAPYIVGWNYEGYQEVTEDVPATDTQEARTVTRLVLEELPPPAEHPETLQLADVPVWEWIRTKLVASVRWKPESDDPKDSDSPSKSMPSGEQAETSTESPSTETPKRRRTSRGS